MNEATAVKSDTVEACQNQMPDNPIQMIEDAKRTLGKISIAITAERSWREANYARLEEKNGELAGEIEELEASVKELEGAVGYSDEAALEEAQSRFDRGEWRECLIWLERALGRNFSGLAEALECGGALDDQCNF